MRGLCLDIGLTGTMCLRMMERELHGIMSECTSNIV